MLMCFCHQERAQEMKETTTTPPPVANKRGRKPGKKSSDKVDIRAKLGLLHQPFVYYFFLLHPLFICLVCFQREVDRVLASVEQEKN